MGVEFNATSLHQLETYGAFFPNTHTSIRVNPGMGSGGTNRTNVGGPASSFGIWHEYLEQAKAIAKKYDLTIIKLHTHIGSGWDPEVWKKVANMVLDIVEKLPDVMTVSLGWGFKVARMDYEKTADLQDIGTHVKNLFWNFSERTGRKLHLEIEPGTFLAANSASLITEIIDIVDTGEDGYNFIKVNAGMTEVTRPSLYGAQHPIVVVPTISPEDSQKQEVRGREIFSKWAYYPVSDWENNLSNKEIRSFSESSYIVVGHNCESGDIFTPTPGDPEWLLPRTLAKASIWDTLIIEWVGAYCSSMSTHGYNSFPEAGELLLRTDGTIVEIRRRAEITELWRNEIAII
jgi:diaminopimelate decarboxylase